jgi:hypothetical protein
MDLSNLHLKSLPEAFVFYLETYPAVTSIGLILLYVVFLVGGGVWLGRRWSLPLSRDTGAVQLEPRVKDTVIRDK